MQMTRVSNNQNAMTDAVFMLMLRPNYDFCTSQGSVATVLEKGRQNYGHLRHELLKSTNDL